MSDELLMAGWARRQMKPYKLLNRVGLIGLYRKGLFNPSDGYEGTFFQKAWESKEYRRLFVDLT